MNRVLKSSAGRSTLYSQNVLTTGSVRAPFTLLYGFRFPPFLLTYFIHISISIPRRLQARPESLLMTQITSLAWLAAAIGLWYYAGEWICLDLHGPISTTFSSVLSCPIPSCFLISFPSISNIHRFDIFVLLNLCFPFRQYLDIYRVLTTDPRLNMLAYRIALLAIGTLLTIMFYLAGYHSFLRGLKDDYLDFAPRLIYLATFCFVTSYIT